MEEKENRKDKCELKIWKLIKTARKKFLKFRIEKDLVKILKR